MPWKTQISALCTDLLKLASRAGFLLISIFVSAFCVWFTAKLLLKTGRWLNLHLFD